MSGDLVDGHHLGAHMVVHEALTLTGDFTPTEEELSLGARCAAEVLLQTAARLIEVRCGSGSAHCCGAHWQKRGFRSWTGSS